MATLAGRHFLKALFVLAAQLVHPPRCSVFQFGMIFVFPGTGGRFKCLDLAQPHELFFSGLGQEFTASSFAHKDVNTGYQLLRNDNVSSLCTHDSAPEMISKSHSIQSDINCSVDLRSTTAVGDRRYSRMPKHLCRSV